jgi:broad-specificity NMP kinase
MLKITISGRPGEGKTTAAFLISKALQEVGFYTDVSDEDIKSLNDPNLEESIQRRVDDKCFQHQPCKIITTRVKDSGNEHKSSYK